jgi:hypothetical protein
MLTFSEIMKSKRFDYTFCKQNILITKNDKNLSAR